MALAIGSGERIAAGGLGIVACGVFGTVVVLAGIQFYGTLTLIGKVIAFVFMFFLVGGAVVTAMALANRFINDIWHQCRNKELQDNINAAQTNVNGLPN